MRFRWFWVRTSIKTVIYIADLRDMAHLVAFNVLHVNLKRNSRIQQSLGRYLRNHRKKATFFAILLVLLRVRIFAKSQGHWPLCGSSHPRGNAYSVGGVSRRPTTAA